MATYSSFVLGPGDYTTLPPDLQQAQVTTPVPQQTTGGQAASGQQGSATSERSIPGDLDSAQLKRMLDQWRTQQTQEGAASAIDGYTIGFGYDRGPMSDAQDQVPQIVPGSGTIYKKLNDGSGKYDTWSEDGKYLGRFKDESSAKNFGLFLAAAGGIAAIGYAAAASAAASAGATTAGAGGAAAGTAAGGMSAAEQIAFLAANGMTDAQIVAAYPALASAGGLTGVGGAAAAAGAGALAGNADKAALYGEAGYGPGMTGAETAAYDAGLAAGSSPFVVGGTPTATGAAGAASGLADYLKDAGKLVSAGTAIAGAVGAANSASKTAGDSSKYDALFQNLLSEQQKVSGRGDDQWANYLSTFRPLEQKMASSAMNYDTPQRREMAAQEAMGQVASSFDQQRQQFNEEAIRYGMDPTTITAMGNAGRLEEAKAQAGAANQARTQVENTGLQLVSNAANFGRNLPNSSTQMSSVATGTAGTAAGIANSQAQLQQQNQANKTGMYSDLLNAGLTAYGMFSSSKKVKHVGKRADGLAAVRAVQNSPSNHWRYTEGEGDGNTKERIGPMAEDLQKVAPQVSDGKTVDGLALIGLQHAAIGNLAKRVDQLEKEAA